MTDIANHPNPAALFYFLFEGHPDAYGLGGTAGGKVEGDAYEAVQLHCFKGVPCGIYPMTPEGTVRWGCSDFDTRDALSEARKVQRVLQKMGIESFLEVSRSKGYHLWVFADEFVPAALMRRTLLFAHHVAEVPPREVNPKQEKPGPKGYGNYVRLPYVGMTADSNGRRIMVDERGNDIPFMDFLKLGIEGMTNHYTLQRWADKYKPPTPQASGPVSAATIDQSLLMSLNGYCRRMLTEGVAAWRMEPGAGGRSAALARLAHEVRKSNQPREVAKAVLLYADDQWGKYVDREDRDKILDDLVNRAY